MIPDYGQLLRLAIPQGIVVITALVVMAIDGLLLRHRTACTRFSIGSAIASLGCAAAILRIIFFTVHADLFDGALLVNPLAGLVQIAILSITILTLLVSIDSDFTEHVGEFILLILTATAGMMFLIATHDLLVIFLSLELLSLSLYILTAFNKRSAQAWEAALKYFLFGGMSAAFLLFGFSLLYGLSNSTNLTQIAAANHGTLSPILVIAIVMTALGLGFKIAAAPFHFWAPDVYLGAPAPSAAFIASASKVASFYVFFQVVAIGFAGTEGSAALPHLIRGWVPLLALMSVLSMLLGNLVALRQTSLRRLLAYSAIAHAGYMLLGLIAHSPQSLSALLYYVFTYALANLGIFAILAVIEQRGSDTLSNFAGLSTQSPVLAFALGIFVLSLAGIPPLAGFFGKFYLFSMVVNSTPYPSDLLWLIVLAIAMSAVSLYYYLRVLKYACVAPPATQAAPIHASLLTRIIVFALAAAIVLLGCCPNLALKHIQSAITAQGF